jgi:hypothetical protein
MTGLKTHDGAAVQARRTETEQEPDPQATYLIGPSSTIDRDRLRAVLPPPEVREIPLNRLWLIGALPCRFAPFI